MASIKVFGFYIRVAMSRRLEMFLLVLYGKVGYSINCKPAGAHMAAKSPVFKQGAVMRLNF